MKRFMAEIPSEYIEKIKDNSSLEALITTDVQMRRVGSRLVGCCPFHSERTPSFYFTPPSDQHPHGRYKCYGCGKYGSSAIDWLMERDGLTFRDAVRTLAKDAGINFPYDAPDFKPEEHESRKERKPIPEPTSEYLPMKRVEASARIAEQSNLFKYLVGRYPSRREDIIRVFWEYRVGCSKGKVLNGCDACSTFPLLDIDGNCRRIKVIPYPIDSHHRIKSESRKGDVWQLSGKNVKHTFFGSHLLRQYPDKPLAIVESEKTAIVGQIFFPQFLWLATGGKSNLMVQYARHIKGRVLNLFPDVDGLVDDEKGESWIKRFEQLKAAGHNVLMADTLMRQCNENSREDVCDIILRIFTDEDTPPRPLTNREQAEQAFEEMKQRYPAFAELAEKFDLEPISVEPYHCKTNEDE